MNIYADTKMADEYNKDQQDIIIQAIKDTGYLLDTDIGFLAVLESNENIDDFIEAQKNFNRPAIITKASNAVAFEDFQVSKGDQGENRVIVDLGDFRVIVSAY